MTVRLHFVVEGHTEEGLLNRVLRPHLAILGIYADGHSITTSQKAGKIYRGGLTKFEHARKDMELWMKQDKHNDSFFTTMLDLYGLPNDFPGYAAAAECNNPYERVKVIEDAFAKVFNHPRFLPYIQLYEFEALIFSDPQKLDWEFLEHDNAIRKLVALSESFESPEQIDDGEESAPSKRIIQQIPEYEAKKTSAGPIVTEKIGLATLRRKCLHFSEWINRLESLATKEKRPH